MLHLFSLASNAQNKIENFNYICPPYFQSCGNIILPSTLPESWGSNVFYGCFIILVFLSAYFFYKKKIKTSLLILVPPTLIQLITTFFLTIHSSVPFEYFHSGFLIVLLFFPNKMFFLRLVFIVLYFCSGIVKLDDGWILGYYFTSLKVGLPLIPDYLIPVATNTVIFFEGLFIFFLFSRNRALNRSVYFFFIIFHLYSIFLVGVRYPIHCLPILFFLFDDILQERNIFPELNFKKGLCLLYPLFILFLNIFPRSLDSLSQITYSSERTALNMFDVNRQCISKHRIIYKSGDIVEKTEESNISFNRCNIYESYFPLKQKCLKDKRIDSIFLNFQASLNGGLILTYVDNIDICNVSFYPWRKNSWIKSSSDIKHEIKLKDTKVGSVYPTQSGFNFQKGKVQTVSQDARTKTLISTDFSQNIDILKLIYKMLFTISFLSFSLILYRDLRRKRWLG